MKCINVCEKPILAPAYFFRQCQQTYATRAGCFVHPSNSTFRVCLGYTIGWSWNSSSNFRFRKRHCWPAWSSGFWDEMLEAGLRKKNEVLMIFERTITKSAVLSHQKNIQPIGDFDFAPLYWWWIRSKKMQYSISSFFEWRYNIYFILVTLINSVNLAYRQAGVNS